MSLPNIDASHKFDGSKVISPPCGESDTQLISALLAGEKQFNKQYSDGLPYMAAPWADGTYNSNSYNTAILNYADVGMPQLFGWSPGATKPVPLDGSSGTGCDDDKEKLR